MEKLFLIEDAAPMIVGIAVCICIAIAVIAVQWRKMRQAEVDAALKQEMIQRGMSANEIATVLQAKSKH
jgi:hypothetical protein